MKLWITRDPNGDLYVHAEKPFFASSVKAWLSDNWMPVSINEYPEVTFENSPMEVELVPRGFTQLVRRMREAQVKRFEFYTDDGWWADRAIELEKEVDKYLQEQADSRREGNLV